MEEVCSKPVLLLEGISKVYPGTVALENIHFEALPGEVHGLIGKNGAEVNARRYSLGPVSRPPEPSW